MKTYHKFIISIICAGCILSGCSLVEDDKDIPIDKPNNIVDAPKDIAYPKTIAKDNYDLLMQRLNQNPINAQLLTSLETFSMKSFQKVWNDNRKENINYSPVSLYFPLMLNLVGSKHETNKEFSSALHIQDKKMNTEKEMNHLYNQLYVEDGYDKLKIANSLWIDKQITFLKNFQTTANKDFFASVYATNFSKQESADQMAAWIREHTSGNIRPTVRVNPDIRLAILNTIDLKVKWSTEFDEKETKEKNFYSTNNKTTKMPFMKKVLEAHHFVDNKQFSSTALNLQNSMSMHVILPKENISISQVIESGNFMNNIFEYEKQHTGVVTIHLPKFEVNSKLDLVKSLKSLGIERAFDKKKAQFQNISSTPLYIDSITQESFLKIDEKGIEASAYTEEMMKFTGMSKNDGVLDINLNRPFIYIITKYIEGREVPIFMGVYQNP